jgi:hypothetical protein
LAIKLTDLTRVRFLRCVLVVGKANTVGDADSASPTVFAFPTTRTQVKSVSFIANYFTCRHTKQSRRHFSLSHGEQIKCTCTTDQTTLKVNIEVHNR